MGKKEASKGREWEKGRRNILNQKFLELHKELPSYVEGKTTSKKSILSEALSYINQIRQQKKVEEVQSCTFPELAALQNWVQHILEKFTQIFGLLNSLNVKVPESYTSIDDPPFVMSSEITALVKKIGVSGSLSHSEIQKKKNSSSKKRNNPSSDITSPLSRLISKNNNIPNSKKDPCILSEKVPENQSLKCDTGSNLSGNPTVISSNPVVVQPSSLQMPSQLLFAPNTSSSPLPSSLPIFVSVTGVKTVNPFILLQSNSMASSSPSIQKVISTRRNIRPIQPSPLNKSEKKLKKIPIPSLKHKSIRFGSTIPQNISRRVVKRESMRISSKASDGAIINERSVCKKITTVKESSSIVPLNVNNESSKETESKCPTEQINNQDANEGQLKITLMGSEETSQESLLDGDKENVSRTGIRSKRDCDGNKVIHCFPLSSASKEMPIKANYLDILENQKEADMETISKNSLSLPKQNAAPVPVEERISSKTTAEQGNTCSTNKCVSDEDDSFTKHQKLNSKMTSHESKTCGDSSATCSGEERPAKMSKSNYSISALCAQQQQLLQLPGIPYESSESSSLLTGISLEKNSMPVISKVGANNSRIEVAPSEGESSEKTNGHCFTMGKIKESASFSADLYSEWLDKSKSKSDRGCVTLNLFSSLPFHNNKNTFIPINEIDGFKTVAESFDASDSSFGLPLHSSEISNDLFASLQVPTSGHHQESISPTAAFLLAFPLVSTSKATELLSDESVCENNDSQSGMKTILQIGNLDCDTPVTKCVNEFTAIEGTNNIYSAAVSFNNTSSSATLPKRKSSDPSVDNFPKSNPANSSPKSNCQLTLASLRGGESLVLKEPEPSISIKAGNSFLGKSDFPPSCVNSNKNNSQAITDCASQQASIQIDMSRIQSKEIAQLASSENVLHKSSLKGDRSQESTSFIECDKQTNWIEIPHSSQNAFPDLPSLSTSNSECSATFALPPTFTSSCPKGEEVISVSRSQLSSSSGILSWSTLSPQDSIIALKTAQKSSHFQDVMQSSKPASKVLQVQSHTSISASGSNHIQVGQMSSLGAGSKLNALTSTYNQNQQITNSSKLGLPSNYEYGVLFNHKETSSFQQNTFVPAGRNSSVKKSCQASVERKHVSCSSFIPSSTSTQSLPFSQPRSAIQQETLQSTSMLENSPSKVKEVKANYCYNGRQSSQNLKSGMNQVVEDFHSKQANSSLNCTHNSMVPEQKQTPNAASYNHEEIISIKGTTGQIHDMNTFSQQSSGIPKQHGASNNPFATGNVKKNVTNFSEAPTALAKTSAAGLNFNIENSLVQFNSSSSNIISGQLNGHEEQQAKSQQTSSVNPSQLRPIENVPQEEQHFARATTKETVTNLHRPPVNWMTAPDIRSHQHHSGPSFGNSGNMSNAPSFLYLPEHCKDFENNSSVYDQSTNFHCLDIPHSGQSLYKGNELHLFGNETIDTYHDNSAWSPNKSGGSSMLGNMIIPSTLPTLVGDLALGDNNLSRPFLPSYGNDSSSCNKKSSKRSLHTPKRSEKTMEDTNTVSGQDCAASFLSVSQLVDTSNPSKGRNGSMKDTNVSYSGAFNEEGLLCQSSKSNSAKSVPSNYSTEALLSSSNAQQINQHSYRKRRTHGTHFSNNFVGGSMSYQNNSTNMQTGGSQSQFLPDLPTPRANEYQSTYMHADAVPSFMLGVGNPSRPHRSHSYSLQSIPDRTPTEESSQRPNNVSNGTDSGISGSNSGRHRMSSNSSAGNTPSTSVGVPASSNVMDFGYINVPSAVIQDDINFTNHHAPPHPPFLPHHTYPMAAPQDTLYTTPRLHPPQSGSIQSPSATTLTNFHLSTIFPEINEKVIC